MKKILVIDDDKAVRRVAVKTLRNDGYEVLEAADGKDGLELARERLPDLVLSDIMMSGMDGFDVLQSLRSQPATSTLPIILMTGVGDDKHMRQAMELGADDFLPKPFTLDALSEAVRARLERQQVIQERAKKNEALLLEILAANQDLVAVMDAETRRLSYLNQAGRRMLGIGQQEDIGNLRLEDFEVGAPAGGIGKAPLPEAGTQSVWSGESALLSRDGRKISVAKQVLAHAASDRQPAHLSIVASDITERKRMDHALRESEQRYRELVNSQGEGVVYSDAELRFTFANPAAENLFGVWPGQLVGKKVDEFLTEKDRLVIQKQIALRQANKKSSYEIEITTARGERRQIRITGTPQLDSRGGLCGTFAILHDVTQRKRAEQALRESQRLLKTILDNIPDPAWLKDAQGRYLVGNRSLAQMYKCRLDQIVGKTTLEVFPEHAARLVQGDNKIAGSGKPVRSECMVPDAGGCPRWFDTIETPIFNEQKVVTGTVGIARDVTERRQMEGALRESEERYHSLFENMLDGFACCRMIFDQDQPQDFVYLDVNAAFEKLTGLKNVVGKKVTEVIPGIQKTNPELFEIYGRVTLTGKPERFETQVVSLATWFSVAVHSYQKNHFVAIFENVTDRKKLEADLRQKTALFEGMVNCSPDGILVVDGQARKILQNPQFNKLLKIPSHIVEQSNDAEQLQYVVNSTKHPDQFREKVLQLYAHPEETSRDEVEFKDGRVLDRNSAPVLDRNGKYCTRIWTFRDITARKQMEQALRESESRYRELLDSQDDGVAIADAEQRFTYANPALGNILDLPANRILGRNLREFLDEEQKAVLSHQVELHTRGKKSIYEVRLTSATGEHREVLINATPRMDRDGRFCGIFAVLRDITERKRTEKQLRLQTSALTATANGIVITDTAGKILWVNPAFSRLTGYDDSDVIGKTPALLKSGVHDQSFYKEMWDTVSCGYVWQGELVNRRKDGCLYHEQMTITPVLDEQGKILNFVAIKQDISQRIRDEVELRTSEDAFRALADNVPDAVARIDRNLRFVYGNRALCKDLGQELAVFLGKSGGELNMPEGELWQKELQRVFQTGMAHSFEFQWPGPDGVSHRETRLVPERSANGEVEFVLAVTRDVTEQKQAEQERQLMELQLRQAQKLEAIGQLAAGIAHEINTPAQYVGDNTRFLKDAFDNITILLRSHGELFTAAKQNTLTPELLEHAEETMMACDIEYLFQQIPQAIQETLEGVERVTKIVRAMKEFSHPGGKDKSAADLNKAIESTTTVARNEWKYVADLKLDLDPELPLVPCFIGEFNQVILNLVVNAAHAIGDVVKQNPNTKGIITLQTRRDGDQVEVRVSDTGTGIAEAHRRRIFEPFFTTKEVGKGSGQGLALVYTSITKKHGGTVSFETEMGKGTTFLLRLPINAKTPAVDSQTRDEPAANFPANKSA